MVGDTESRHGRGGCDADHRSARRLAAATGTVGKICGVPRLSAFYGITIWMYHDEIHHRGRPHFHARYAEDEASIEIDTFEILAGSLPPRALKLVTEWATAHHDELRANWDRARRHETLAGIDPLS